MNGFHSWWKKQGHTTRSADSYRSGIRRVNDDFFVPAVRKDMFDELDEAIAAGCAVDWLTALVGVISAKIDQTEDVIAKKRLQDNRSKLKRFIEYVAELQEYAIDSGFSGEEILSEKLPDGKKYYTHEILIDYFSRCLSLNDYIQVEAPIFLPIRILGRLFNESANRTELLRTLGILEAPSKVANLRKWYRNWLKDVANRVSFYSVNGNYELHVVDGLLIDSHRHRAWIRVKGKDYALLTYNKDVGLQEMNVDSLRDIRPVSVESIESVLTRLAPILITLRRITDDIKASFSGRTIHLDKFDFNKESGCSYTIDLKLDDYLPQHRHDAAVWYCNNVNWPQIAPLLSLVRLELNYIYAASRIVAKSEKKQKK